MIHLYGGVDIPMGGKNHPSLCLGLQNFKQNPQYIIWEDDGKIMGPIIAPCKFYGEGSSTIKWKWE